MTPSTLLFLTTQLIVCVAVAWACGVLVLARLSPRIEASSAQSFGVPERALTSALSFLALGVVLMVGNIVTGGAVFAARWLVPVVGIALVIRAMRERPLRRPSMDRKHIGVVVLGVLLIAIFVVPVLLTGSGVRAGDPPWHLGWTEQLLAGEPVPTGPAPEFGRNAYPWGFHAVLATMVRLTPGSDPLIAHETVHMALVGLIPLAAACLARLVNRRAGVPAAWLAGLVGGFGWLSPSRGFVASPSEARFGADLVVASPNSVYELFPPALPREVALVALGAATLFLATALRAGDRKLQVVAGAAMGAVGLISVPMMLSAVAWSVAMCVVMIRANRIRSAVAVVASAVLVFALWAGPVVADYLRFNGFVDITPQLGKEWELGVALASWGILLPLAIAGIALLISQPPLLSRPLLACIAASAVLFTLALARARLDWGLFGNETLLHQGRMWPPLHLLGAAAGGLALVAAYGWLRARSRPAAVVFVATVLALGIASPIVAAGGITKVLRSHTEGFDYAEPDLARDAFVRRAAAHLGPRDVVQVEGSDPLAFYLFQFSGTKLATYDDPRLIGNELRIRYADLAEQWDRRVLGDGFEPDYYVVQTSGPEVTDFAQAPIESGTFGGQTWELYASD